MEYVESYSFLMERKQRSGHQREIRGTPTEDKKLLTHVGLPPGAQVDRRPLQSEHPTTPLQPDLSGLFPARRPDVSWRAPVFAAVCSHQLPNANLEPLLVPELWWCAREDAKVCSASNRLVCENDRNVKV